MFKWILISVVVVPVLLGMQTAGTRRPLPGLQRLLVGLIVYDVLYVFLLHYLRLRWVG